MKFGFRMPSLTKRVAARTSWKRMVRHSLGLKAPRGWGWLTNPKKAAYNRVYYRTTIDPVKAVAGKSGCRVPLAAIGGNHYPGGLAMKDTRTRLIRFSSSRLMVRA